MVNVLRYYDETRTFSQVNATNLTFPNGTVPAAAIGYTTNAQTSNYTVQNADRGKTIALGGSAFYTLTFNAASGYDADFRVTVVNTDTGRAKIIAANGLNNFFIYPGQSIIVFNQGSVWFVFGQARWKVPGGTVNLFTDFTSGVDTNDGLAAGAGNAKKTVQAALDTICNDFDFTGYSGIAGEPSGPTILVINMAASTTDTQGVHFSAHDGPPGAQGNAAVKIVGGAGATISTTSADALGFFCNWQIEISNVTLTTATSGNCITSDLGATVNLLDGVTFGACAGAQMSASRSGQIYLNNSYTVSGNTTYHMLLQNSGIIANSGGAITVTVSASITDTIWVNAANMCNAVLTSITFSLGANTVTGKRYEADNLSLISTNTGSATYFPGTVGGTTSNGGVYQ